MDNRIIIGIAIIAIIVIGGILVSTPCDKCSQGTGSVGNRGQSSANDYDCEKNAEMIADMIEERKDCTDDSDCVPLNYPCPFGCGYYNKGKRMDQIELMISNYTSNCEACLYKMCYVPGEEGACIGGKCMRRSCAVEGEKTDAGKNCCMGLTQAMEYIYDEEVGCTHVDRINATGDICIDCGDGICNDFENVCNCPKDCETEDILIYKEAEWGPCIDEESDCTETISLHYGGELVKNGVSYELSPEETELLISLARPLISKDCQAIEVVDYWATYTISLDGETKVITYPGCEMDLETIDDTIDAIVEKHKRE